jgi:hypothetical protein
MLTWWTIPLPGGMILRVLEGRLAPLEELEPFSVSLDFDALVLQVRVLGTGHVALDGVVDDEIYRAQRVDLFGSAPEAQNTVSHSRQVHDGRNSSEILQEHS